MFSKRSTGHNVGKGLFAGAAAAAVGMFFAPGIIVAGAGLLMAGGGAYLHEKLYLDDPEAVAEYRKELHERPLSDLLVKKYSLEDLLKIVDANQILELYKKEVSDDCISTAIRHYGMEKLRLLNVRSIVTVDTFRRQTNKELDEKCRNFTEFWHNTKGNVAELITSSFVESDRVKQKFLTEFSWVGMEGQLYHHEEPADGHYVGVERPSSSNNDNNNNHTSATTTTMTPPLLLAGEPIGLVRAFHQYFEFVKNRFEAKPEFFRTALQTSVYGRRTPLNSMIEEGLMYLALTSSHSSPLVNQSFIQQKFEEYCAINSINTNNHNNDNNVIDNRSASASASACSVETMNEETIQNNNNNIQRGPLTLWRAEKEISLRELLENNLIIPGNSNSLSALFHAALPRGRVPGFGWDYNDANENNNNNDDHQHRNPASSTSSSQQQKVPTKENNIVLFCDYWEKIFKKFQNDPSANFIEIQYSYVALAAWRRGVDAKREKKQKIEDAEKLYERTKSQLDDQHRNKLHHKRRRGRGGCGEDDDDDDRTNFGQLRSAAETLKKDTIERAEEDYEKNLKWIHGDFCAQINGQYFQQNNNSHHQYHGTNNNNTNNTNGCAQQ